MHSQRLALFLSPAALVLGGSQCGGSDTHYSTIQTDGDSCKCWSLVTNVKDFGAKGDGAHDDTAAIQAAISSLPSGGQVFVPATSAFYPISTTLEVNNVAGLSLVGAASGGSVLRWGAPAQPPPAGVPMIRIKNGSHVSIKSLAVYGNAAHPPSAIIESLLATDQLPKGVAESSTNVFEDLVLGGEDPGMANLGIEYDKTPLSRDDANGEGHFNRVEIRNVTTAAVSFELNQTRAHVFTNCRFQLSQRGVATSLGAGSNGGSFHWYGGDMKKNSVADFDLGNPNDVILISGLNSQGSGRLITTTGPSSTAWPVTVEGTRWAADGLNDDGQMIVFQHEGPLNLIGNLLGDAYQPGGNRAFPSVFVNFTIDGTANLIGNTFLAENSVDHPAVTHGGLGPFRVMMQGNTFSDAVGAARLRADPSTATGPYAGLLGISATNTASNNLRGTAFTSGTSAIGSVAFATPEVDSNYYLVVTPGAFTGVGGPPAGSNRVLSIAKGTAGFDLTIEAAPGDGNTMEFDWVLIR